ncbi:muscle LIM protein Mlp84B-like isoform X1 [Wyeomyia smithii]|uniref:muscle LIM protein Mlp84B-like isoform X1 n=1 Tax=Wyeomyia smithii TaxID=174621 RepID=UPI0024680B3F|nr:muscle LIM protein Mlp84B-like isoform X1 [Wyeomyia smithii]XP_055528828.1 muscle LIM protein Mlp84B-like isoform X1 [Wyeomyia smithii]XP_055528829.1 muscle LIM protein Mlp84B-like isoform X1 [Wyeomyia smithii]XP_055528830.1 muscle LIM protein Mlp84B-like isoform X1 [Wyeomyia smithii]XP_055528831.1 muscle LIM protein Mlp84B-like isoform X1 [Wyeomyia smithii]
MPFKPAENPKCPKCNKSVYAAEERVAGGHKWHKGCFKCGMCGKMLDSTNCAEHENELYCKNCHGRKYGPKGYGFGGGAGCLSMDTGAQFQEAGDGTNGHIEPKPIPKAPEGEGCPRCGGYVYMAEQMLARGRGYHRRCFKCLVCNRTLDSTIHCDGPDKEIYCRGCYASRFGSRGYGHSGISFLGLMCDARDLELQSEFTPKPSTADTTAIKASPGQGCPRCGGVVFAAEMVLSKGREWHRKCYKCRDCTKTLDSIIACDGPDHDVYCKTCYGKKWGPHGYGFACGSGFLQTDCMTEDQIAAQKPSVPIDTTSIKAPEGQGCPRCGGMVFAAEQQLAKGTMWHKKCFNCAECHRPLDSMIACDGPDREIHCRACYGKLFGPKGFGFGHTPTLVSTDVQTAPVYTNFKPMNGPKAPEGKGCRRCGYTVYEAEKMLSKNLIWHKRCFSCFDCHKSLDSTNLNDAPNGEIYCRGCYGRNYGPRGVGFGIGAGALTMT